MAGEKLTLEEALLWLETLRQALPAPWCVRVYADHEYVLVWVTQSVRSDDTDEISYPNVFRRQDDPDYAPNLLAGIQLLHDQFNELDWDEVEARMAWSHQAGYFDLSSYYSDTEDVDEPEEPEEPPEPPEPTEDTNE